MGVVEVGCDDDLLAHGGSALNLPEPRCGSSTTFSSREASDALRLALDTSIRTGSLRPATSASGGAAGLVDNLTSRRVHEIGDGFMRAMRSADMM